MVICSHHHQIQMLCQHLQPQNHSFHSILLEILSALHLVSMCSILRQFWTGFSHDQIHIKAHTMESADSPRMQNEPGSSSRVGQPIQVDEPDHAVIPGDVEMQCVEFEVGANDENSNFQPAPDQPSDENPLVESQSPQSSEPQLLPPRRRITSQQFERDVRARQSTSSFHPVPSREAAFGIQCG